MWQDWGLTMTVSGSLNLSVAHSSNIKRNTLCVSSNIPEQVETPKKSGVNFGLFINQIK
jgi:hypothetical protein